MKVSGFTFVKNAVKYEYPVLESISSVLPVVDEMIICLGNSDDSTNELIGSLNSDKIKIIHSVWDDTLTKEGKVLAVETDKAMDATAADSDWLFYIQADEVLHEQYYPVVKAAMEKYKDDKKVEGLLFHYHHFYGSHKYIGDGRKWYSKEIRVIRNNKDIRSYRDAQGFRWNNNRKLNVKLINAYIYHYGWVRSPFVMQKKYDNFSQLWSGGQEPDIKEIQYDYSNIDSLILFTGSHPAVMKERVAKEAWDFNADLKKKNFKNLKHKILYFFSKRFGWKLFEYSNYNRI